MEKKLPRESLENVQKIPFVDTPGSLLFLTSEISPFMKTGGLGDYSQALPPALFRSMAEGGDVRIFCPGFLGAESDPRLTSVGGPLTFDTPWGEKTLRVFRAVEQNESGGSQPPGPILDFLLVDDLFDRKGLYGEAGQDYPDNFIRYFSWSLAVFVWMGETGFLPDVVHGNDWQTGMFFPLLRLRSMEDANLSSIRTVFTIHNLAFKGLFPFELFSLTGFPASWGGFDGLEYYGDLSMIKGGIVFSDYVTTVSPTYRNEVLSEPLGAGLSGALKYRGEHFLGILNGIDDDIWNPLTDPMIERPFSRTDLSGKEIDRHVLIRKGSFASADAPVIGCVTRMTSQKGIDLLLLALDQWLAGQGRPFSFFLLGTGDPVLEKKALELEAKYRGKVHVVIGFDEGLSHQIYAGSDFFMMPSRYEPCGLAQMYAMRYGAIPLVFPTGGLRDTVSDGVDGLWMSSLSEEGVIDVLDRALDLYQDKKTFFSYRSHAMDKQNGWEERTGEYLRIYAGVLPSAPEIRQGLLMARMALKM